MEKYVQDEIVFPEPKSEIEPIDTIRYNDGKEKEGEGNMEKKFVEKNDQNDVRTLSSEVSKFRHGRGVIEDLQKAARIKSYHRTKRLLKTYFNKQKIKGLVFFGGMKDEFKLPPPPPPPVEEIWEGTFKEKDPYYEENLLNPKNRKE